MSSICSLIKKADYSVILRNNLLFEFHSQYYFVVRYYHIRKDIKHISGE